MVITIALVMKILVLVLICAAIYLVIEVARTVFQIRKLVNRLDMLTDAREWLNFFKLFSRKKNK